MQSLFHITFSHYRSVAPRAVKLVKLVTGVTVKCEKDRDILEEELTHFRVSL
jgi:hypothetical protein